MTPASPSAPAANGPSDQADPARQMPPIRARTVAALGAILIIHLILLLWCSVRTSINGDEGPHLAAGLAYWRWGEMSIYNLSPPMLRFIGAAPAFFGGAEIPPAQPMLNAPPSSRTWLYYDQVEEANFAHLHEFVTWGRWALIPLSPACCALIFFWARRLYGDIGGLLAAALWAFDPTVLAQGSMLNTDIGLTLTVAAAAGAWIRFVKHPTPASSIVAALLVALAHTTKFTAMLLWPAMIALALLYGSAASGKRKNVAIGFVISALLTWVAMNACYGFLHVGKRLDSLSLQSALGLAIKSVLPAATPVPLARHLVEGFDAQKFEAEGYFAHTLLSEGYFGTDWRFYPLALGFKTPLGALAAAGLAAASMVWRRPTRDEVGLLILAATIYLGLTFVVDLTSGLRYLLVLYPFAIILFGRLANITLLRYVALAAVVIGATETMLAAPRFHAFFNAIARPYRMEVPDLGWGQSLLDLRGWIELHGRPSVAVFSSARTSPSVYGLEVGDATAPIRSDYVALSPVFLGGIPVKYHDDFVILRPWRQLRAATPAADLGGILVYRTADIPSAQEGRMFTKVKSWVEALDVPELAPIRGLDQRLSKKR